MDKTILLKLGLNDREISIYTHLIKTGVQTVKQISQATSVNRTTTYRFLESLEKKGLIEWVVDERGKKARGTSPDNLLLYLKHKKNEIEQIEKILPNFVSQLHLLRPSEKFSTQVRYYKDQEGIKQIIWNTLQATEIMRSYTVLKRREFIDPAFEDKFEVEWVKRGLKDRVITNETRKEYINTRLVPDYKQTLKIRIVPSKKFYITNDITIYNNTVAIASLEKDNLVGVEIENAEIAKTQKSIFNLVWEIAKPIK